MMINHPYRSGDNPAGNVIAIESMKDEDDGQNRVSQETASKRIKDAEHYKVITTGEQLPYRFFGDDDRADIRDANRQSQRRTMPRVPYFKDNAKVLPSHEREGRKVKAGR